MGRTFVARLRILASLAVPALLAAACQADGSGDPAAGASAPDGQELGVAIASFDLAVGEQQRLMAGLFTIDRELLAFGEVTFEVGHLGDEPTGDVEPEQMVTASFLPVPGMEPEGDAPAPVILTADPGSGVYEATVDLDEPGFWALRVVAELEDGTVMAGTGSFPVGEVPEVPAVGDEAPRTVNHTVADVEAGTVQPVALDSRAQGEDPEIPDLHLHDTTIAEAIEAGRPAVVVFSTPVYCQSRFCGPLVNVLADLAHDYEDRAEFIMVEVWEDFEETRLSDAAAEWIQTELGGNEPWAFLIDGDGRIAARWDNVLDVAELEEELARLPAGGAADDA